MTHQYTVDATEPFFTDLGTIKGYEVGRSKEGTLLLSRDGGYAKPISKQTTVKQPGTYFLTEIDQDDHIAITRFQIPVLKDQNEWRIQGVKELPEIFKYSLENYKENITLYFDNGTYKIEQLNEMIHGILEELMEEYPKLSYVSYHMTSYGTVKPKVVLEFTYALDNITLLKVYNKNLDKKVAELIQDLITPEMKDYEREWVIANYLASNLIYAPRDTDISHTMQGALMEGVAVCDGYAKSAMYLLNSIGVPTQFVTGTANGGPHAWNLVKLGDGYYHVDLTWADSDEERIGKFYNYLNETDAYMKLSHRWEEEKYPKASSMTYLSTALPVEQEGIYKVESKEKWEKLRRTLREDGLTEANIIFNDLNRNKWSLQRIIENIIKEEERNIAYYTFFKYDSLIVNYRIY